MIIIANKYFYVIRYSLVWTIPLTCEKYSGFKVLVEEGESGRILGAHILGQNAEEVINIFAIAVQLGISADKLKKAIFSYPTNTSNISYML
jgi:glutathione reductase (NADPH)